MIKWQLDRPCFMLIGWPRRMLVMFTGSPSFDFTSCLIRSSIFYFIVFVTQDLPCGCLLTLWAFFQKVGKLDVPAARRYLSFHFVLVSLVIQFDNEINCKPPLSILQMISQGSLGIKRRGCAEALSSLIEVS